MQLSRVAMTPFVREVTWSAGACVTRSLVIGTAIASVLTITAHAFSRCVTRTYGESKSDIAQIVVKKYALEAFPEWVADHPDRSCPRSLAELAPYMGQDHEVDPWGQRYHVACGPHAMPRTARGIWVISAGEDGVFGTDDDARSDR